MIEVTVMYPGGEGATFDHDYYVRNHIPLVAKLLGDKLRSVTFDRGISGGQPDAPPPYVALTHLVFDSIEDFRAAMGPHAGRLGVDAADYTNSTATVQISERLVFERGDRGAESTTAHASEG